MIAWSEKVAAAANGPARTLLLFGHKYFFYKASYTVALPVTLAELAITYLGVCSCMQLLTLAQALLSGKMFFRGSKCSFITLAHSERENHFFFSEVS